MNYLFYALAVRWSPLPQIDRAASPISSAAAVE